MSGFEIGSVKVTFNSDPKLWYAGAQEKKVWRGKKDEEKITQRTSNLQQ